MQTGMINSTPTPTTPSTAPSNTMDKNSFLKLLVAQLKNQDPTQSQDPNQMVQQMTSFSSLEQAQNTNTLLTGIQAQNSGLFQSQTASLIGKKVKVSSASLDLKSGKASVGVELAGAAKVTLTILDATGKSVATLSPGSMTAGSHAIDWNGKDYQGNALPDGTYTVAIDAVGTDGTQVKSATSASLTVSSVSFFNGTVMITAGGKSFSLSDINEISA